MSVPQARVQVAFDSAPMDAVDKWTDITSWVDLGAGITYGRGRKDERSQTTAQTCNLMLDNRDARFTAASTSSPYYPNLLVGKKLRVSVRLGTGRGNLLAAEDASFEGGTTGAWQDNYFGGPAAVTLANSATHPSDGTKGLLITWPTAAAGCSPQLSVPVVKGRTYTLRAVVWVPAGSPAVQLGDLFGAGATVNSTTTGAFQTLTTAPFVAGSSNLFIGVKSLSATTAGQQCYVDALMLDEGDASLGAFTTAAPPISDRYTGYVLAWPAQFPGGNVAMVPLTATDRIGYLDALRQMGSAPSEAILAASPTAYWPLTDEQGATSAGEISGNSQPSLQVASFGAGQGTAEFGAGTGPATDSASALMLTPASSANGRYLSCTLTTGIGFYGFTSLVCFNTSTSAFQTMVRLQDGYASALSLNVSASGVLSAIQLDMFGPKWSLSSPTSVADGRTHVGAVKVWVSGTTVTATLWLDGVQVASTSYSAPNVFFATYAYVGGSPTGGFAGDLFTGTMSHVAAWTEGGATDIAAISSAILDGLAGQTVNASLSQVAAWADIAAGDLVAETGSLTETAHRDTTGQAPASVLLALANDEGGVLYVDGSGRYKFQARDHRWTRSPVMTLDTQNLAATDVQVDFDTQGLANDVTVSRPGGGVGQRVVNKESIDGPNGIGRLDLSLQVAANQDGDLIARAGWEANVRAYPYPRVSSLPIDLLTMDAETTLAAVALDVGDTVRVETWPSQAAAQAFDLTFEGWTERLSLTEWSMDVNTSRSTGIPSGGDAIGGQRLLMIDDPTSGLDMGFITGY